MTFSVNPATLGRIAVSASVAALTLGLTVSSFQTTPAALADPAEELGDGVSLTGAGASFPAPIYQRWAAEINDQFGAEINYQSVGSGAGKEQFGQEVVDFGASDVAMSDEEMAAVDRGVILLPMTAGGIVLGYNLDADGIESGLNLTRETYIDILLGNVTNWNDPAITDANPDVDLPDLPITVVHRSDGSGTTGVFTAHLSDISEAWADQVGQGTTVEWPAESSIGARGNEGITAQLRQTDGAIGYLEYGYAVNNGVAFAALENASGNFILPDAETTAATLAAVELPENLRAFITDPEGDESYPVVTYTWMLMYEEYDEEKGAQLEAMIEYGLNEGQSFADELGYIPLPQNVRERVAEAADVISDSYEIEVQ